jgi:hypothetical protein
MAMECQGRREAIREALHDATAHYLRHLDSVTGRYR